MNEKHDTIIAKEGYVFILIASLFTVVSSILALSFVTLALLLLTVFIACFFRNPERKLPVGDKLVISPADGRVIKIEDIQNHELVAGPYVKISIFMNIFNVHVNRIPYSGTIETIRYCEGKFFSANLDKASLDNERNGLLIRMADGRTMGVIQIAGLIARRIVCWVKEDMKVEKGERFGLIRFGSRVDVLLPSDTRVAVKLGDKVRAGETPIGVLS